MLLELSLNDHHQSCQKQHIGGLNLQRQTVSWSPFLVVLDQQPNLKCHLNKQVQAGRSFDPQSYLVFTGKSLTAQKKRV
jgi:hypothetical protein